MILLLKLNKQIINLFKTYVALGFVLVFLLSTSSNSGLNKYSLVDKIGEWIIEQKIQSVNQLIECRAYMSTSTTSTWFGDHMRLDENNRLIIPADRLGAPSPSISDLEDVIKALEECRKEYIYIPNLD